jgi:hypothetical protein
MSLFILLDPLIDDNEFKTHCLFFMAIMAFSTVLINGTTAKYVLEWLGLLKMTPQQLDVLQYVLKVWVQPPQLRGGCVNNIVLAVAVISFPIKTLKVNQDRAQAGSAVELAWCLVKHVKCTLMPG